MPRSLLALLLLLLAGASACSRGEEPPAGAAAQAAGPAAAEAAALLPVPEPDLSASDPGVRRQIEEKRAALAALLEDPEADPAATARSFGDLGLVFVVYEFLDAAQACFANAVRLAPDDFRWPYLAGYADRIAGDLPGAAERLERALALEPEYLPALVRLGGVRLELGEAAAARDLFRRAAELDPESAAAAEGLGRAAEALGDDRAAVEHFERALALEPEATAVHYPLAQAYRRLGDLGRARAHLEDRGFIAPRIPDPLINPLAGLGESAQFYVMQGGEAMEAGQYEVAAAAYREALARDPSSLLAARGLAYGLERMGDPAGAMAELAQALDRARDRPSGRDRQDRAEAHRMLAGLLVLAGRDAEAVEHFHRCLELAPEAASVRLKLANALARQGRLPEATDEFARVADDHPELTAEARVKRATALVNLGRADEARADFRRAIEAAPGDPTLRLRFAAALEYLGDAEGAARERRAAAGLAGEAGARVELAAQEARGQIREGRVAEAAERFAEAVELAPERTGLRFELATALGEAGRFDDALVHYARILEEAPDHAGAHRGAITILLLQGRYGQVRMQVQDALSHAPRDVQLARLQARVLATAPDDRVRDGRLALELASRLHAYQPDFAARELLALAHAELGHYDQAVELVEALLAEAEATGRPLLARELGAKLSRFRQHRPWRAEGPEEILFAAFGEEAG